MKFISLICPYCAGQINLYEDHKFGECIHCGHKVMLINDEIKRDERSDSTYPEFESVRYFIESGDVNRGSKTFAEKYRDNPDSAHGWLLCGYLQLMGYSPLDDTSVFKKMMRKNNSITNETRLQGAFSSWKRGFSTLDNQYYLTDYCKAIGLALASEGIETRDESIIPHLEDIKESIESHFDISFSADFYYFVLKGYLRRKGSKNFYSQKDLAFDLMTRTILYERDVDALAIKSQLLNNEGLLDEYCITKDRCVFFLFSLIYREMSNQLTKEQKANIRNGWREAELFPQNYHKWKSLMTEDYSMFDKDDLKVMMDNIGEFITFDDSEENTGTDENSEEKIDLKKYERIIEQGQTFKQKISKKRIFTQYIVIDDTLYSRSIELSLKEFDGNVDKKSDLEKLKTLFDKEYEDVVVGASGYYYKYTPEEAREYLDDDYEDEDEDDYEIDEELDDFWCSCIELTNILESKKD